jgi:hypothetical protein
MMLNGFLLFLGSYIVVFWWGFTRGRRRGKAEAYGEMAKTMDAIEEEFQIGPPGPLEDR